jgi:hypothetical protein
MSDDLPSGKRMWELAKESIEIDRSANEGCSLCYELYVADFEEAADRFARRLDETENRFFETACSIGNNYRPPSQREENEPSAHEIRMELKSEVEGYDEHEYDEPEIETPERKAEWAKLYEECCPDEQEMEFDNR